MNLEVGNYYLRENGDIIKIADEFQKLFYYNDEFIAEIPKELHWWIIYNIKNFHINENVRKKLRRKYTNYVNCCLKKDS